ncbi:FAD-dependent oxidoreductase [Streptomyces sp. NPDC059255]|uniref:FAD-dependent oxidoreductase n=1 Tax=Streptomyces sp. NPDC059255 TaxID=3346793 RepID=UPI0036A9B355
MVSTDRVLVIGGGVAGLATAIGLDMAGRDSVVFEAASHSQSHSGASLFLGPAALGVLETMKLSDEVHDRSMPGSMLIPASGAEFEDPRLPEDFDFGAVGFRCIDRAALQEILSAEAARRGIEIHYDKRLITLNEGAASVLAHFQDGTTAEGSLLVGADGRMSRVRSLLFPGTRLTFANSWYVYGTSTTDGLDEELRARLERGEGYHHDGPGTFLLAYRDAPARPSKITFLLTGQSERKIPAKHFEHRDRDGLRAELADLVGTWSEPGARIIERATHVIPTQVYRPPSLTSWYHGRTVLAGDAVHATDPLTGLGSAFAFEDALYLAKMLRDHDYRDAFYYFQEDRRPHTSVVQEALANGAFALKDGTFALEEPQAADGDGPLEWITRTFDIDWDRTDTSPLASLAGATTTPEPAMPQATTDRAPQ